MGHHEKAWLERYEGPLALFYHRYVDDTLCLFNSEQEADAFFNFINSRHPNIKFTMEKEMNNTLAFLDVFIDNKNSRDSSSPVTSVYRKKTYTGLLTNYFSFTSFSYKLGLIRTLVDRSYKINNTWSGFHEDLKKLKIILEKNLFPIQMVDKVVNKPLISTWIRLKPLCKPQQLKTQRISLLFTLSCHI